MVADQADGCGAHACDIAPVGEDDEHFQECAWVTREYLPVSGLDVTVVDPEALVDGFRAGFAPG